MGLMLMWRAFAGSFDAVRDQSDSRVTRDDEMRCSLWHSGREPEREWGDLLAHSPLRTSSMRLLMLSSAMVAYYHDLVGFGASIIRFKPISRAFRDFFMASGLCEEIEKEDREPSSHCSHSRFIMRRRARLDWGCDCKQVTRAFFLWSRL